MHSTTAACCLSIVLDSSVFHTIRLSLFILDFLRQGTHQTVVHTTSLESHHPEDLSEPPSYVATSSELIMLCSPCFDKSRLGRSIAPPLPKKQFCSLGSPLYARLSTGRKYHYPLCLSSPSLYLPYKVRVLKSFLGVCSCSLSIPNSRRKVSDVLIFCFQGSQRYKITPSLYLPLSERVDNHKNKKLLIFYDFFKFFKDAMLSFVHCHL